MVYNYNSHSYVNLDTKAKPHEEDVLSDRYNHSSKNKVLVSTLTLVQVPSPKNAVVDKRSRDLEDVTGKPLSIILSL